MLKPKVNFKELKNIYKKKSDKKGQGSLVAVILASVIGTVIVGSITQWYLSMNRNVGGLDDRLESMTIAMSEWQRLEHMSLDELEANREKYKTPYQVGDYKVSVNLGAKGYFSDGKCGATIPSGKYANCFQDTTMTIYNSSGEREYTTRTLPLMAGLYTREEIDEMLKHYVKNDDATNQISMKYDATIDKVTLFVDGKEAKLNNKIAIIPQWDKAIHLYFSHVGADIGNFRYVAPENGTIYIMNCATNIDFGLYINGVAAYHKCGYSTAGVGYVPVAEGDIVTFSLCNGNSIGGSSGWGTYIYFFPNKIV